MDLELKIVRRMLIFIFSEVERDGHISIGDTKPYYFIENEYVDNLDKLDVIQIYRTLIKVLEEMSNEMNDKILLLKNQYDSVCDVIDMQHVTDIDIIEIHPAVYIFEFKIDFKKKIIKRISGIEDVVNLKQLLEKLGRYDFLLKLY